MIGLGILQELVVEMGSMSINNQETMATICFGLGLCIKVIFLAFFFFWCVGEEGNASCTITPRYCVWAYLPFGHILPCQPYPLKPPSTSEPSHIPLCEVHNQTFFVVEVGLSLRVFHGCVLGFGFFFLFY